MSKISDIRERHPEMVIDLVEMFAKHDPSKTLKYLEYMVNVASDFVMGETFQKGIEDSFQEVFEVINKFDKFIDSPIIKNKDIYSYGVGDLVKVLDEAEKHKTDKYIKERETIHLYRDEDYNMLIPLSYASSLIYGANTKWCTASNNNQSQFQQHMQSGVLIYVINKKQDTQDKYKKIAWYVQGNTHSLKYDNNVSIWDCQDRQIKGFTETFELMNRQLDKPVRDKLLQVITTIEQNDYTTQRHGNELKKL